MALVELMQTSGMSLLDVQWCTDHLASLGAVALARQDYLARLAEAVEPTPINTGSLLPRLTS
jgi:leucyl/phenylalanyl-tRNA--protein transferase